VGTNSFHRFFVSVSKRSFRTIVTNMRNDITVPFCQLRNRKNDVTVTFWPTVYRKERCNRFILAKSLKKRTKNRFFFYKKQKERENGTIPMKKKSQLTTTRRAVLEQGFLENFLTIFLNLAKKCWKPRKST
jgi:hypothetical protein